MRDDFRRIAGDDGLLRHRHRAAGIAVVENHVGEKRHVLLEHQRIAREDQRLLHPGRRTGRPHGVTADGQHRILLAVIFECRAVGIVDFAYGGPRSQNRLHRIERHYTGFVHSQMTFADLGPGQHHAHARRVIMPPGDPELEGHLVVVLDVLAPRGVTQVERRLTAAKRRNMRRQVGAQAKQRVVKGGVDITLVGAGKGCLDGFLHHFVHDLPRPAEVVKLLRTLYEAQLADEIRRHDRLAPAFERRLNLEEQARRQPHGIHLDTDAPALHAERIEHLPNLPAARRILRIHRDADIVADG